MSAKNLIQVGGTPTVQPLKGQYAGSSTITPGMILCYDTTQSTADNRFALLANPTLNNAYDVAGVVVRVGETDPQTGYEWVDYVPVWENGINVEVLTDESVAAGDLLGVIPGSLFAGRAVFGRPFARAQEAVDGTTTAAPVQCTWGVGTVGDIEHRRKIVRWVDDFTGENTVSTTADLGAYLMSGTSAAAVYADLAGSGLAVTTNTTNQANLTLNGEPFTIASNKSVFFRVSLSVSSIAADTDQFVGLSITDTAYWSTKPTDYVGFEIVDGVVTFTYVKDGTTGVVTQSTGVTIAADEVVDLAFLVRNRAGTRTASIWVNGTQIAHTTTSAEIPDDELLTVLLDVVGSAARSVTYRQLEAVGTP